MKPWYIKAAAITLCVIMTAGCKSEGKLDIDLTPLPDETQDRAEIIGEKTEEQEPAEEKPPGNCFIAYDPETSPGMVEFLGSYGCEPGYIYFEEDIRLLLDKKCKLLGGMDYYQNDDYFWTVSEDNEVIKVNKRDGTYEVLFALDAPDGNIYDFMYSFYPSDYPGYGRVMYFAYTDGYDSHLIILDRDTDKYEDLCFEEGLKYFYPAGWQESMEAEGVDDEPYICDVCGYTGNYVIWKNNNDEFFWYHPETGENTPLVISENTGMATVFVLPEQGE